MPVGVDQHRERLVPQHAHRLLRYRAFAFLRHDHDHFGAVGLPAAVRGRVRAHPSVKYWFDVDGSASPRRSSRGTRAPAPYGPFRSEGGIVRAMATSTFVRFGRDVVRPQVIHRAHSQR